MDIHAVFIPASFQDLEPTAVRLNLRFHEDSKLGHSNMLPVLGKAFSVLEIQTIIKVRTHFYGLWNVGSLGLPEQ